MNKAIDLSKSNANNTRDEIKYLRSLIIGSPRKCFSAEARLYEAEAKEVNFIADRHLAQLTIFLQPV